MIWLEAVEGSLLRLSDKLARPSLRQTAAKANLRSSRGRAFFGDVVAGLRNAGSEIDPLMCTPNPHVLCHGHPLPDGVEPGEMHENEAWNSALNAELGRRWTSENGARTA